MYQESFWEANRPSATQEIRRLLWNCLQSSTRDPTLSPSNSVYSAFLEELFFLLSTSVFSIYVHLHPDIFKCVEDDVYVQVKIIV